MTISIFKNAFQTIPEGEIGIEDFINAIKFGRWAEIIDPIRQEKDKERRQNLKKGLPLVTASGTFSERKKAGLLEHSGCICLDFDDVENVEESFDNVSEDPFVFAAWRSVSGNGFAALVKIDPKRHLDAFLGLEAYFVNKYQLYIDKSCKDVSRSRFVSYDPNAFSNPKAKKFSNYLPKSETNRTNKLPRVITGKNDLDFIVGQIVENSIDLTDSSYSRWLEIGFAIAEEYGEGGRDVFHNVSQFSSKYTYENAERQFNHCLKNNGSGINFATFLYHAKNAGVSLVSPETKFVATAATMAKRGDRGIVETKATLKKVEKDISPEIIDEITDKVFAREEIGSEVMLSKIEAIELFLSTEYDIKRNEITRYIEESGKEIDTNFLNSIYIRARKEVDDKIKFDEIDRIISSDFTPEYNPLKEYFERNAHLTPEGKIDELIDSIKTNTGFEGHNFFPMYKETFFKKWIVGIIASIYGQHSPLLLVLTGGQGTGKTEFFRRLLPEEFQSYYAESKLDAGKDDEILMCQKVLILDDEFGGKSKFEAKRLKELTSKAQFDLREPYGRKNVKLRRLAVLCGTSNDESILSDPTGNRRIIPLDVQEIDHVKYNEVDKREVLLEAYHLYKSGFNWNLTKEEINVLADNTHEFEQVRPEKELILRYFRKPEHKKYDDTVVYMQSTEIKAYIERVSGQKLSPWKIGQELKVLGFTQTEREIDGHERRVFPVIRVGESEEEFAKYGEENF